MAERLRRVREEVLGVLSIMGSLYLLLSLFTHHIGDPVPFFRLTEPPQPLHNLGGVVGAYSSGLLIIFFGITSYLIPLLLIVFGISRLMGRQGHWAYILGAALLVVSASTLLSLISATFNFFFPVFPDGLGGLSGRLLSFSSEKLFSVPGSYMLLLSVFFTSVILLTPFSLPDTLLNRRERKEKGRAKTEETDEEDQQILITEPEVAPRELVAAVKKREPAVPRKKGDYEYPSLDFLHTPETVFTRPSNEELLADSALIEQRLADFGVDGKITKVNPGPIVTMYEFDPAPGVKINRIVSLAEDLALALKAQSVRAAPIPGRAVIGIEVPNRQRETVGLREILSSEGFRKSRSKLTFGLGKDISGTPVVADLAKMPHLLVAGATGSGKSVSVNSMVMSVLYKAAPTEVKMLMVDPKLLELSAYEGIPHLISPVITSPKEASEALKKMVLEMERRYRVLAEKAARNIDTFNLHVKDEEQLPYIIVIIDELADLMFTAPRDVEDSITRLAQMGRASGIHLILATQRPSVDVITGIIKANFPARVSFHVSSKVDSRTILDGHGAEQLLGKETCF
jgi:DNA segregation ATPase FtsK/SpoIIIE, S-DNA-T family